MAIWQFSIVLIPKLWAQENSYNSLALYDENGHYDTEIAWKQYQPNVEFIKLLSTLLPRAKSCSNEVLYWGNETGHDISLDYENELINEIYIRLDLSENLNDILEKLVKVTNELSCVFFFPEFKSITEANEIELNNALKNCIAAKWLANSDDFLEKIEK